MNGCLNPDGVLAGNPLFRFIYETAAPFVPCWAAIVIAGLVIMVAAIAWMLVRRITAPTAAAYWRGRPVETEPQGKWERFRRWLAR